MEWAEIADVEGEERAVFHGCEGELLFIRDGVLTGFFGSQDLEATATQVKSQPGHDLAIEGKPDEEHFKAGGTGHGPALPQR